MEVLSKDLVPFGRLHIPPREENLTASYAATSFEELAKTWKFRAYLTYPGTNDPMDLPSVTLTVSSAPPGPRPEVVQSLERSLREHGDVWAKLARE